jgi:hypothetical protein
LSPKHRRRNSGAAGVGRPGQLLFIKAWSSAVQRLLVKAETEGGIGAALADQPSEAVRGHGPGLAWHRACELPPFTGGQGICEPAVSPPPSRHHTNSFTSRQVQRRQIDCLRSHSSQNSLVESTISDLSRPISRRRRSFGFPRMSLRARYFVVLRCIFPLVGLLWNAQAWLFPLSFVQRIVIISLIR